MKIASTRRDFASRGWHIDVFTAVLGLVLLLGVFLACASLYYLRIEQIAKKEKQATVEREKQVEVERAKEEEISRELELTKKRIEAEYAERVARIEVERNARIAKAEAAELELTKKKIEAAYAERKKAEAVADAFRAYSEYCVNKASVKEQERRSAAAEKDRLSEEAWTERVKRDLEKNGWHLSDR